MVILKKNRTVYCHSEGMSFSLEKIESLTGSL